jgi:hypothetical protein
MSTEFFGQPVVGRLLILDEARDRRYGGFFIVFNRRSLPPRQLSIDQFMRITGVHFRRNAASRNGS